MNSEFCYISVCKLTKVALPIWQIPAYTLRDDIERIMQAFKGIPDQRHVLATLHKKQHVT